jgi:hypothetical protein
LPDVEHYSVEKGEQQLSRAAALCVNEFREESSAHEPQSLRVRGGEKKLYEKCESQRDRKIK